MFVCLMVLSHELCFYGFCHSCCCDYFNWYSLNKYRDIQFHCNLQYFTMAMDDTLLIYNNKSELSQNHTKIESCENFILCPSYNRENNKLYLNF